MESVSQGRVTDCEINYSKGRDKGGAAPPPSLLDGRG